MWSTRRASFSASSITFGAESSVWLRAHRGTPNDVNAQPQPPDLVIVDEADRVKTASLEQLRDLYDRRHIGLVLIGMPGLQKRLARYAQLYSRIGFVHQFQPLSGRELQHVIERQWVQLSLDASLQDSADAAVLNAIARIARESLVIGRADLRDAAFDPASTRAEPGRSSDVVEVRVEYVRTRGEERHDPRPVLTRE